jgi:hypothetical protein
MKKLFLLVLALMMGFGLLIDNSFFRPASRKIASDNSVGGENSADSSREKDLSKLDAEEFARAFKYSLINPVSVVTESGQMGVQLGNFYIKGTDQQKIFVCSKYNFIELIFQAEGIAVSGEIPRMVVRGPCANAQDLNFIQALPIPYKKILATPVSQNQFRLPIADSNDSVQITFHYVVEQWPTDWNLVGVRLYSDYSSEILSLNGYEIIAILGQPFVLNW